MSTALQTTLGTPDIPVRRMGFEFDDAIPKFWFEQNSYLSMLMTALSCTFPEGERMFIRAVRRFQDGIRDPQLQQDVRAFIGQEANHGKEHEAFNAFMARKGLPIDDVMAFVKKGIAFQEKRLSPERMLAKTCALEHFTALFAEKILSSPELLEKMDEGLRPLWLWHAIEESEHKSVAFDVYQEQVNNYWLRVSEMATVSVLFTFFTGLHTVELLLATHELKNTTAMRKAFTTLLGKNGFFRGMLPHYLAYYRRDYHPAQVDSSALRNQGLALLKQLTNNAVPQALFH
ncbi:metal-dependent hydrolase [Aquirhabdus parva]|uniref:Metal-dependent hydrolase n=1 Tax=Aquirhabdus parva TaxID=2283318 RepID=A0A345P2I3_9GAMM|nr:metal-dependent hydrolase [Aquirhabdus parva]AXI01492.1 metal-dependent hydrolase [Aquirhabdus parva]